METFLVKKGDVLHSCKTRYRVMDFIGEGSFGKVAQCLDLNMGRRVALKIHKNNKHMVNESEVAILEKVRALDPDQNNIVKYIDNFRFNDISCLAFEMLDRSLWKLMEMDKFEPLSLAEIRSVTYQLLVAFEALKNIGIMHTDLKPDNIMLVNHRDHPFKVKLIDFGLALPVRKAKVGMTIQPAAYRALEVNLGLPLSESVDMWGVGCIMAFMYFGMNLFPSSCAYKWMKTVICLLGHPNDFQITTGKHSLIYFTWDECAQWRLRTPEEYHRETGIKPIHSRRFTDLAKTLESLPKKTSSKQDNTEERVAFFDLLKCCLHLNAEKRIRPREALKHIFITNIHSVDAVKSTNRTKIESIHAICLPEVRGANKPGADMPPAETGTRPKEASKHGSTQKVCLGDTPKTSCVIRDVVRSARKQSRKNAEGRKFQKKAAVQTSGCHLLLDVTSNQPKQLQNAGNVNLLPVISKHTVKRSSLTSPPSAAHRPPLSVTDGQPQHHVLSPKPGCGQSIPHTNVPSPVQSPSSDTLIIGDSIIRNVKLETATTYCFPTAKVLDLLAEIPLLLHKHPHAKNVVIHVGTNNISVQTSEVPKLDFTSLFQLLKGYKKSVFISGPIPSICKNLQHFSRLLCLHIWLQSVCASHRIVLIDNFNHFWGKPSFFSRDGIHPNPEGSSALAANILHAINPTIRK